MKHLLFILMLVSFYTKAQVDDHVCDVDEELMARSTNPNAKTFNGSIFTPDKTIRTLVAFVVFKNTHNNIMDQWPYEENETGPGQSLPSFIVEPSSLDYEMEHFLFRSETDFDDLNSLSDEKRRSPSSIYNTMSKPNRDFKLIGEIFSDENKVPIVIEIDPNNYTGIHSWNSVNDIVGERLQELNPDFDYSQFDSRNNWPGYTYDNSDSNPDNEIDLVTFVYRYSRGWADQDQPFGVTMRNWGGSSGGVCCYSRDVGEFTTNYGAAGITMISNGNYQGLRSIFVHELGHGIFGASHINVNGVIGNRIHRTQSAWGATSYINMFTKSYTAFERWINGYLDPEVVQSDDTYLVGDFMTMHEAIKIPIPGTSQSAWIEYHSGDHPLDQHQWYDINLGPSPYYDNLENNEFGLYIYIEDIATDRNGGSIFVDGANGIKFLHAGGNFDLEADWTISPLTSNWGNPLYLYNRGISNPLDGVNPGIGIPSDKNGNGIIHINNNPNDPSDVEAFGVLREIASDNNEYVTYGGFGVEPADDLDELKMAFQPGDKIGMDYNPSLVNYPKYSKVSKEQGPIILNGLYVEVLEFTANGYAILNIKINEIDITTDKRWCGIIELPNIINDESPDLIIHDDTEVKLDMSGTVNRHTPRPETGLFINPTKFTVKDESKILIKSGAILLATELSTLILEEGSEIILEDKASIVIESTATLNMVGGKIKTLGPDSKVLIRGNLISKDGLDIGIEGPGYVRFEGNPMVDLGQSSTFVLERIGTATSRMLEIGSNTTVEISNDTRLNNIIVIHENNSELLIRDSHVDIFNTEFIGSQNKTAIGLILNNVADNSLITEVRMSLWASL